MSKKPKRIKVKYILVRAPALICDAYASNVGKDLQSIGKVNKFNFCISHWVLNDIYVVHKSQQALEELVNMYALSGGDTTYYGGLAGDLSARIIQERAALFMDCAKLLEAIK